MYNVSAFVDTASVMHSKRTFSAASAALLLVVGLLVAIPGLNGAASAAGWRYTMVAFSNASDRTMDVYQSTDGTDYQVLQRGAYTPPTGLVRDPSIFRNTDGTYYVTYTTGDPSNIGLASSRDRVHWTFMENWPVPLCCFLLPGTGDGKGWGNLGSSSGSDAGRGLPSLSPFTTKAWAPDWFVDNGRVNIVFSMSTGGGFVPYVMTALDPGLRVWSFPVPLGIQADHIDTTIVKIGGTYHAITKNETKKVIEHWTAPTLTGPYTPVPITANWGSMLEGPAVVQLPNGTWRIYLDAYTRGKYFYADSTDGLRTWSALKELPGLSGTVRHAGVMREPA